MKTRHWIIIFSVLCVLGFVLPSMIFQKVETAAAYGSWFGAISGFMAAINTVLIIASIEKQNKVIEEGRLENRITMLQSLMDLNERSLKLIDNSTDDTSQQIEINRITENLEFIKREMRRLNEVYKGLDK